MPVVVVNASVLAIAAIYYAYRDQYLAGLQRAKLLRERVTFLLWTASQRVA